MALQELPLPVVHLAQGSSREEKRSFALALLLVFTSCHCFWCYISVHTCSSIACLLPVAGPGGQAAPWQPTSGRSCWLCRSHCTTTQPPHWFLWSSTILRPSAPLWISPDGCMRQLPDQPAQITTALCSPDQGSLPPVARTFQARSLHALHQAGCPPGPAERRKLHESTL